MLNYELTQQEVIICIIYREWLFLCLNAESNKLFLLFTYNSINNENRYIGGESGYRIADIADGAFQTALFPILLLMHGKFSLLNNMAELLSGDSGFLLCCFLFKNLKEAR